MFSRIMYNPYFQKKKVNNSSSPQKVIIIHVTYIILTMVFLCVLLLFLVLKINVLKSVYCFFSFCHFTIYWMCCRMYERVGVCARACMYERVCIIMHNNLFLSLSPFFFRTNTHSQTHTHTHTHCIHTRPVYANKD